MTTTKTSGKKATTSNKTSKNKVAKIPVKNKENIDVNIFPTGKLNIKEHLTDNEIERLIEDIRLLPKQLKVVYKKIEKEKELQYSYKEGGWSVEQIFHHIADSHLNSFIRFKLALTENNPTIAPYDENLWTETADVQLPIKYAIKLVKALHKKWVALLENMDKNDWKRTLYHPANKHTYSLEEMLQIYAWHGKHHIAQIKVALRLKK